jgi:hypothetical protein
MGMDPNADHFIQAILIPKSGKTVLKQTLAADFSDRESDRSGEKTNDGSPQTVALMAMIMVPHFPNRMR